MKGLGLVGYVDRWSGHAGEELTFFVSSVLPRYRTQLVRLIHGDEPSRGMGVKEELVPGQLDDEHDGLVQDIPTGSCMRVELVPPSNVLTFATWLWPTRRHGQQQCIFARENRTTGHGCRLLLSSEGKLVLQAHGAGESATIELPEPLALRRWSFAAAVIDEMGMRIHWRTSEFSPLRPLHDQVAHRFARPFSVACDDPLLLGASALDRAGNTFRPRDCFNGKLSDPLLFDRALSVEQIDRLASGDETVALSAIARWDFVAQAGTMRVPDTSGNGYDGHTLNRPTRLVTGHNFSGRVLDPTTSPREFNAVHFHDDDLADAGWLPGFRFKIPSGLRSGVYAAKLSAGPHCDYIPFVIRPHPTGQRAPLAFLLPTVSYVAYANSGLDPSVLPPDLTPIRDANACSDARAYAHHYGLLSTYDRHTDGSGVCTATMLRPMPVFVRPGSRSLLNGGPHQLGADLHVIDWLEAKGIPYDVITDHDLDREGIEALRPYRCVVSGTHAEYWTGKMLDVLHDYTQAGGRFIYASGNGLYWVTALSTDQTLVEIRRHQGTRSWNAAPGEAHLSLSGELGGLWRDRGRAPQKYVGVGFAAQGFDTGRAYRRSPASNDPRVRFIFEGVDDELIGDIPTLVSVHGAAGYEVDRADTALGTPEHALVLATASGFSDCYQNAIEEVGAMTPYSGGTKCGNVRGDMVFFETPNDGAVFSVGSIAWCSALSYNEYDNNVSRITENVVRAFTAPGALPGPSSRNKLIKSSQS
jgi:N,N-dimethylformamidase